MAVVATAGHVDHGKSALVRAITGTDPDRLPEERRRGMTIELGHVWADVDGRRVAVVDVPGHDRLVGTTLAGLGPVAGVLLVIAADEGWRAQTEEHVAAVRALGLTDVALVVTRSDLADPGPATADALARLAAHGIAPVAVAAASARTGAGLADVRAALAALADLAPAGDPEAAVRLWVDRSFTVTGAGTVVTGTLPTGSVTRGGTLLLDGEPVRVRGLQVHGEPVEAATGPTRLAVNLRGVAADAVPRGSALLSPGWPGATRVVDVVLHPLADRMPSHATLHVGTTSAAVRVRPLGTAHARLTLDDASRPLPLVAGDRVVLRDPAAHEVLAGATVVDAHPAALTRRGDAVRRAATLTAASTRGTAPESGSDLGCAGGPSGAGGAAGAGGARGADGAPGAGGTPTASEPLLALLAWLDEHPLESAPAALLAPVTAAELAGAERAGRLVRLGGLTLPGGTVELATTRLAGLPARFSPGDAARALGTSRRVAIPLLERLDARAATVRHPDGTRTLRGTAGPGGPPSQPG
ncbi:MAG TPA: selenocysteine-specific translation elongation factor [Ornithinibacter sp.]|nr:selenocysteine-specific translation elongation factor [Ornithinibacter sp.]